jgi:hypothetical protein
MNLSEIFIRFREAVHAIFPRRADATMNLIDALSANAVGSGAATSPVQLSESPLFPRQYSSLHDAVANFSPPHDTKNRDDERESQRLARMRLVAKQCPPCNKRKFYIIGVDATSQPRPFARTLEDRSYQHAPNPIPGNKPITIGHSYSILAALLEKETASTPPWILPMLTQRIPSSKKAYEIGKAQIDTLLSDETLPFGKELTVSVADCHYSTCEYLFPLVNHSNLIQIVRVGSNRVFYRQPEPANSSGRGRGCWYGTPFKLNNSSTHHEPNETITIPVTFKSGRQCLATMDSWSDMLMRGKRDIPIHNHPFTLVRIRVVDQDGKKVFKNSLWLLVVGERRREISLKDIYEAYIQRFDLEHFFRFGKNRLLMASYQTPDVEHEENWWEIVSLAYVHLFVAAPLVNILPRPWERWLPSFRSPDPSILPSPSMVQRDLFRIIQEFGTPALLPKHRGKSPGRQKYQSPGKRKRLPVVKKSKKRQSNPPPPN